MLALMLTLIVGCGEKADDTAEAPSSEQEN